MRVSKKSCCGTPIVFHYGPVEGVDVGNIFNQRRDLNYKQVHQAREAIDVGPEGPYSILLSGTKNINDFGYTFVISTSEIETLEVEENNSSLPSPQCNFNASLMNSYKSKLPIRVVRSSYANNQFCPKKGYRYDGLYHCIDFVIQRLSRDKNKAFFKFVFSRITSQKPANWLYGKEENCPLVVYSHHIRIQKRANKKSKSLEEELHHEFKFEPDDDILEIVDEEPPPSVLRPEKLLDFQVTLSNLQTLEDADMFDEMVSDLNVEVPLMKEEEPLPLEEIVLCTDDSQEGESEGLVKASLPDVGGPEYNEVEMVVITEGNSLFELDDEHMSFAECSVSSSSPRPVSMFVVGKEESSMHCSSESSFEQSEMEQSISETSLKVDDCFEEDPLVLDSVVITDVIDANKTEVTSELLLQTKLDVPTPAGSELIKAPLSVVSEESMNTPGELFKMNSPCSEIKADSGPDWLKGFVRDNSSPPKECRCGPSPTLLKQLLGNKMMQHFFAFYYRYYCTCYRPSNSDFALLLGRLEPLVTTIVKCGFSHLITILIYLIRKVDRIVCDDCESRKVELSNVKYILEKVKSAYQQNNGEVTFGDIDSLLSAEVTEAIVSFIIKIIGKYNNPSFEKSKGAKPYFVLTDLLTQTAYQIEIDFAVGEVTFREITQQCSDSDLELPLLKTLNNASKEKSYGSSGLPTFQAARKNARPVRKLKKRGRPRLRRNRIAASPEEHTSLPPQDDGMTFTQPPDLPEAALDPQYHVSQTSSSPSYEIRRRDRNSYSLTKSDIKLKRYKSHTDKLHGFTRKDIRGAQVTNSLHNITTSLELPHIGYSLEEVKIAQYGFHSFRKYFRKHFKRKK